MARNGTCMIVPLSKLPPACPTNQSSIGQHPWTHPHYRTITKSCHSCFQSYPESAQARSFSPTPAPLQASEIISRLVSPLPSWPPPPRKLNSSREPAWEEGQCWRVELRTSEGTWVPRLSPPALQRLCAPSPAGREPQAPDSGNTHKQDGGSGSTPYGLAPSRAIGWSLE